jgi:RimJ/RimL family protein N-acetyltransferase
MDPLLLDIPEEFESERMIIRAARPGEGADVNAAVIESLDQLKPWMIWAQVAPSVEETEAHGRKAHARFHAREDLIYRGWLKTAPNTFVVGSGLHRIDWSVPRFEIGYWVRTSLAGRGYVTEIVHAMTQLAFNTLGAERVEIRCDERNERSWRVAERCGFTCEGTLRRDSRAPDGTVRDTRVYSRVASSAINDAR